MSGSAGRAASTAGPGPRGSLAAMSAHDHADDAAEGGTVPVAATPPATGVGAVDRALAALEGLEGLPVAERVAAFEDAHAALRSALDPGTGDEPASGQDRGVAAGSGARPSEPA